MMTESGLGSHPSAQDGLFASATFPDLGEDLPGVFFAYLKRKGGRGEGRQIFLFFLDPVAKQRDKALWGKAEPHCV